MITNSGDTPDRLIGTMTEIAATKQFHTTREENGRVVMRLLDKGIEIPGVGRAVLRPGDGHPHLMFMTLNRRIKADEPFKATLVFENAGEVEVTFRTVVIGKSPTHAGH